ncbi:MAG: hypothetical protein J6W52_06350 [Bacteroidaceae bacterium]|nr:hypothetical protein [Bacteroidaceae bacterium]
MKKLLLSVVALMATFTANAQFSTDPAVLQIAKGESKDVVISLKTEEAPVAYNLYVQCPEGIDVATYLNDDEEEVPAIVQEGSRYKSHHSLTVKPVNGVPGRYMVACASTNGSASNATLKNVDGNPEGAILKITFTATQDNVVGSISLEELLAGFVGGTSTKFDPITIGVNATAINSISAEQTKSGAIYNLSGQRVSKATKGIFIVDGKKVAVQ